MTKLRILSTAALVIALPLAVGCGGGDGAPESDTPAPAAAPAQGGSGSIAGTITHSDGDPDKPISMDADPKCADMHDGEVFTQKVVTGEGGYQLRRRARRVLAKGQRDAVVGLLPGETHAIAGFGKRVSRELVIRQLRFLQTDYVRPVTVEPVEDMLQSHA